MGVENLKKNKNKKKYCIILFHFCVINTKITNVIWAQNVTMTCICEIYKNVKPCIVMKTAQLFVKNY